MGWPDPGRERRARGQLRGSPAGRMPWAGCLVIHGFWELAGYTGDFVCPPGPTSGCVDDLGLGLGSGLGWDKGKLAAFMGKDDRGPVSSKPEL